MVTTSSVERMRLAYHELLKAHPGLEAQLWRSPSISRRRRGCSTCSSRRRAAAESSPSGIFTFEVFWGNKNASSPTPLRATPDGVSVTSSRFSDLMASTTIISQLSTHPASPIPRV